MAGRIPQSFIDELLNRVDIVTLIDSRVPLRKAGSSHTACCPFHSEKTPSFNVNANKQFYHCFGCGVSGNAISFLMAFEHLDFLATIETLAQQVGLEVPRVAKTNPDKNIEPDLYQIMTQTAHYYQQALRQSPAAIDYLKQRGITGVIAKEFGLGYAPSGWHNLASVFGNTQQASLLNCGLLVKNKDGKLYDRFRERITFPIRDRRGRIVGFGGRVIGDGTPKYLNSPETPLFHKGRELYGLYEAKQALGELPQIIMVEGYMDVIALAQKDVRNAAATLGTATTLEHMHTLFRFTSEVVFCFDGDRAGREAAWRALQTTLPLLDAERQVRFAFLPDGEDPDTLVRKQGTQGFNTFIQQAMPLADFLLSRFTHNIDINRMEDKARLVKRLTPFLNKIPAGIYRHMLIDRIAHIVRMDPTRLQNLLETPATEKPELPKPTVKLSPMRLTLALLLQNPALITTIPAEIDIAQWQLPGSDLLLAIVNRVKQAPNLHTGSLLEQWRDTPQANLLQKLATTTHWIPEDGIVQEFTGLLACLQQFEQDAKIEQLLIKANQKSITSAEKVTLQALLAATKKAGNH